MKYVVTRTIVEMIDVEAVGHDNALNEATDYSNQYQWTDPITSYTVTEKPE